MADELAALRATMDELDERLLALVVERARLAREIGHLKRQAGLPPVDAAREATITARLSARAGPDTDPLDAAALRRVWAALLAECRRIVIEVR
jgi:chorismate mutase